MRKLKLLVSGLVFFIAVGLASSSFGAGRPFFLMVWDDYDTYYVLVKFNQNQINQNEAEMLSQLVTSMASMLPADDYGMKYATLTPSQLASYGLGDADYVKQIMTQAGWDYVFIDFTKKAAPVAGATNYNMDIFFYDAYDRLNTYMLSVGIPTYWLEMLN